MKLALTILILTHGLIHFMGFAKAFDIGNMEQLTKSIPKQTGIVWLLTGLLFISSVIILQLAKKDFWWSLALPAVILSQIVIFLSWKDAKFGTIANLTILIAVILSVGSRRF